MKCDKCKEDASKGAFMTSGCDTFRLCEYCSQFLEERPGISIRDFMGPLGKGKVIENMRKAAKLRATGKSPWKNQAKSV